MKQVSNLPHLVRFIKSSDLRNRLQDMKIYSYLTTGSNSEQGIAFKYVY
jgi:hypothetical protein